MARDRLCLEYALLVRRRVKEQLEKIGGMEFWDVHFSYFDVENLQERFISVPEQGGGGLIPEGRLNPGVLLDLLGDLFEQDGQTLEECGERHWGGPGSV